jgi:hypothetical protein
MRVAQLAQARPGPTYIEGLSRAVDDVDRLLTSFHATSSPAAAELARQVRCVYQNQMQYCTASHLGLGPHSVTDESTKQGTVTAGHHWYIVVRTCFMMG